MANITITHDNKNGYHFEDVQNREQGRPSSAGSRSSDGRAVRSQIPNSSVVVKSGRSDTQNFDAVVTHEARSGRIFRSDCHHSDSISTPDAARSAVSVVSADGSHEGHRRSPANGSDIPVSRVFVKHVPKKQHHGSHHSLSHYGSHHSLSSKSDDAERMKNGDSESHPDIPPRVPMGTGTGTARAKVAKSGNAVYSIPEEEITIPNDGNLASFSPDAMATFFRYLRVEDRLINHLHRRDLDGKKFGRLKDSDLENLGLRTNPVAVYFRDRTAPVVKKAKARLPFVL